MSLEEHLKQISDRLDAADDKLIAKGFDHPCRETCSGWKQGKDRGTYEGSMDLRKLLAVVRVLSEALEKIESSKNMTRLADCCVDRSCHINTETNSCSFQTGVHYGNADRAAEAENALTAAEKVLEGKG